MQRTPQIARELSAIGYVFARRVHKAAGVPIGVIDASRGGTTVEAWTPLARLRKLDAPEVKARLAVADEQIHDLADQAGLTRYGLLLCGRRRTRGRR